MFGCHVLSEYGSAETCVLACQCPSGVKHIDSEFSNNVEVMDEFSFIHSKIVAEVASTLTFDKELPLIM